MIRGWRGHADDRHRRHRDPAGARRIVPGGHRGGAHPARSGVRTADALPRAGPSEMSSSTCCSTPSGRSSPWQPPPPRRRPPTSSPTGVSSSRAPSRRCDTPSSSAGRRPHMPVRRRWSGSGRRPPRPRCARRRRRMAGSADHQARARATRRAGTVPRCARSARVRTQGMVIELPDLLATLTVEAVLHLLDLTVNLDSPPPAPPAALEVVRLTLDGLLGAPPPVGWDAETYALKATGRMALDSRRAGSPRATRGEAAASGLNGAGLRRASIRPIAGGIAVQSPCASPRRWLQSRSTAGVCTPSRRAAVNDCRTRGPR